jgi:O-antigen ligase
MVVLALDLRGKSDSSVAQGAFAFPMSSLRQKILIAFFLIGPLGRLLPVPGTPSSFRLFYVLMFVSIPWLLWPRVSRRAGVSLGLQVPFFLYLLWSAVLTYAPQASEAEGGNPVVRAAVLFVEVVFTCLIAAHCQRISIQSRARLALLPLGSYILTLSIGYLFFVGYYAGLFSVETLEPFYVLLQFGYGLLRFSPGSYPNEYGILSSFFASIMLFLLLRWNETIGRILKDAVLRYCRVALIVFFPLTIGALFLASTRAAYISFMVSVLAIGISLRSGASRLKYLCSLTFLTVLALALVQRYFDIVGFFQTAYLAFFDKDASASERFVAWGLALKEFIRAPLLGSGYGTTEFIHNVYLQIFFALGFVGTLLFLGFFLSLYCSRQNEQAISETKADLMRI